VKYPTVRYFFLTVLGWLLSWWFAHAQAPLKNHFVFKADPIAGLSGEFRLHFEKKLTPHLFLSARAGYFYRTNSRGTLADRNNCPELLNWFCGFLNYNRLYHPSAFFQFDQPENFRERIQGPIIRPGVRLYPGKKAPEGFYLQWALSYGFWWSRWSLPGEEVARNFWHRPGIDFTFGQQRQFGHHRNLVIGWYLGADYFLLLDPENMNADDYELRLNWPVVQAGVELGFSFRRKHRHW
jgi:hypothetical protein